MRSARTARTAKNLNNINKTKVNNTSTKVTSPMDAKINEIIKLVSQVNANNKKFIDPKNNAYADRKDILRDYFGSFEDDIDSNKKITNLASSLYVNANSGLNLTKSKKFYREIGNADPNLLDNLLDSLKDLQNNKNVNKTFKTWKKRQDDIRANYMPNAIEYIKDLENGDIYDALKAIGLSDDDIFDKILEKKKQGQFKTSNQLIEEVANSYGLGDLVEDLYTNIDDF